MKQYHHRGTTTTSSSSPVVKVLVVVTCLLLYSSGLAGAIVAFATPNRHGWLSKKSTTAPSIKHHQLRLPISKHGGRSNQEALAAAPRYGPPDAEPPQRRQQPSSSSSPQEGDINRLEIQANEFRQLVQRVMSVTDPQHIPSLLTRHMELLLEVTSAGSPDGKDGAAVVNMVLDQVREEVGGNEDDDFYRAVEETVDVILSFTEDFVQNTLQMEDQYKKLLGKIIRTVSNKELTSWLREEALDELLVNEHESLTAGFLRHLDMECRRIQNAPNMSRESVRLLEILRVIQTRVLEEMGKDLSEAAQVLGQLIGYETKEERIAVLEAGITVRGVDFAQEILNLTTEALDGFRRVSSVDPGLVQAVQEIHHRVEKFCQDEPSRSESDQESSFQ